MKKILTKEVHSFLLKKHQECPDKHYYVLYENCSQELKQEFLEKINQKEIVLSAI